MMRGALVIILLFCVLKTTAQTQATTNNTLLDMQVANAVNSYANTLQEQVELYNGPEYLYAPRAYKGNPYFTDTLLFRQGTITYNGTRYSGVSLLYDSYKHKVVTTRPVNLAVITVQDSLISEFSIPQHRFVHITRPDTINRVLKPGYYEVLYDGETKVLAYHRKDRIEQQVMPRVEVTFTSLVDYYVIVNNIGYKIGGKGALLKALGAKKSELNAYLKNNNIRFNDDKALAIAKLAAYYDQIN